MANTFHTHRFLIRQVTLVLGCLAISLSSFAQGESVSGIIKSGIDRLPIPGVTILEKGTLNGTVTDIDGHFTIRLSEGAVLVFSSIGFATQEVTYFGQTQIDITLQEDITALEEVIIVGYGEQKRSNLSGAISSVKVKDIENRPIVRLDQALQGMSSGVFVSKGGGAPGASPTIHIRGVGSINNTDPLWIIDGVRMAPGNHFNLDDAESIEILKDASASAIYGAQAAHGVILVTTKRGKGKTLLTYKSSFGKVVPRNMPDLLRSEEFVKYKKESRLNAGQNPEPSWDNYENDTDWIKAYYAGSGFSQYHDFSIAKGDDKFNYFFSMGYDNEKGILIDNGFKRYSMRFNSDVAITKWLKIGESMLISRVDENPIDNFNEDYSGSIPYRSIPIMPIYDATNPYGGWGKAPAYFQGPNPVASQYQQHEKRAYNRIDGNVYGTLTPFKGFAVTSRVGLSYMSFLGRSFKEAFNYGAFANTLNSLTYADANDQTITANSVATYEHTIGKHYFKILGGVEGVSFSTTHYNVTGTDLSVNNGSSFNLVGGTFNVTDRYNVYSSQLLSQFGRVNYTYDDKYILEANIRRDASAPKFGPNNIWGIFPSYSAAWRVSEEGFFRGVSFISNLKVRGSTGRLGSDNIPAFLFSPTYTSQFSSYSFDQNGGNKVPGYYISKFPNKDIKWEEVGMTNVGVDLGFLNGQISFTADYYIKDTKDLLYAVPIPSSVGISTHNFDAVNPEVNIGTMRNTGLDLDVRYKRQVRDWEFGVSANTSFMKNELLSLKGDQYITGGSGGGQIGGMTRTQAGMPVSSFYGYIVQRMLNSSNDVFAVNSYADDGIYQEGGTGPGDFMYKDISGPEGVPDGQITTDDRTFIGNPWPKMFYGINLSLTYKGMIDLLVQLQGVQGVDVFNANLAYSRNFFGDNNTTTLIREAWTPEHHTGNPRNIANDPNGNFSKPSTYFIEDGSYLKVRNVQLSYSVPAKLLQTMKFSKARVYVNGYNLFTFTNYTGMDPEMSGSNTSRGVDYGLYPYTRTYSGGIEVQF